MKWSKYNTHRSCFDIFYHAVYNKYEMYTDKICTMYNRIPSVS